MLLLLERFTVRDSRFAVCGCRVFGYLNQRRGINFNRSHNEKDAKGER